jgi:hypothetical protein
MNGHETSIRFINEIYQIIHKLAGISIVSFLLKQIGRRTQEPIEILENKEEKI